jgi:hypothetical protein
MTRHEALTVAHHALKQATNRSVHLDRDALRVLVEAVEERAETSSKGLDPLLLAYLDATEVYDAAVAAWVADRLPQQDVYDAMDRLAIARQAWAAAGFPRVNAPPVVGPDEWAVAPEPAPEAVCLVDLSSAIDPNDLPYLEQGGGGAAE